MATTGAQVKAELREMYDQEAADYDAIYHTPAGQYFMNRKIVYRQVLTWLAEVLQ